MTTSLSKKLEDGGFYKIAGAKLEKIRQKPKRVLLVDDDEGIRELLIALIEDKNLTPVPAENADEAIRAMQSDHPNIAIVFIDLHMSPKNGFTVLSQLSEGPNLLDEALVFVCSGIINQEIIEQTKKYHIDGYLTKPFDADQLFDLLDQIFP